MDAVTRASQMVPVHAHTAVSQTRASGVAEPLVQCLDSPELAAPRGHYSHVCRAAGLLYVSGQIPTDRDGTALQSQAFTVQVQRVLANLAACLQAGGSDKGSLVHLRVYITDMEQWPTFNQLYADWIGGHRPARTVVEVSRLHYGVAIEVEAVAAVRS